MKSGQPIHDQKSNWGKRFIGNTLPGRVVRASYQSVASTVTLPSYLSPWGDNNPVTLPNVRKRDAALLVAGHVGVVGLETLAPSALDFGNEVVDSVVEFVGTELAEQAVDETIDHFKPIKPIQLIRTQHVKSVQTRIKHKLMGVDATIRLIGEYPAQRMMSYDKGWFCPFLYASGRTPSIPRSRDFAIAAFSGPGLRADIELAPKLLPVIAEDASITVFCNADSRQSISCHRILVLFLGISPWRTGAWSQARNPGEARFMLHVFKGIPALVLPVTAHAPICAWSPWTLQQMHGPDFKPDAQGQELCGFLESIISVENVSASMRFRYRELLWTGLSSIVQGAVATRPYASHLANMVNLDLQRAGIVMFRY